MATLHQLRQMLNVTYGAVPIVAGLDKFTNLLTNWVNYLPPRFASMLPMAPSSFMKVVGIIEIIAGLLVFIRPVIGGFVVMAWLLAISLVLIFGGIYFDVAVRDIVMALGAYTFTQIVLISKKIA